MSRKKIPGIKHRFAKSWRWEPDAVARIDIFARLLNIRPEDLANKILMHAFTKVSANDEWLPGDIELSFPPIDEKVWPDPLKDFSNSKREYARIALDSF